MTRVSWLVPVYNAAPYLEASLLSICDQTFGDFEAIVVDDGSTDGSAAIIRSICAMDNRFRYVPKANSGIIDALNVGLTHCKGEYVARMDGDDICEPDRLATQVAYMDQHPDCVVAGSRTVIIDADGTVLRNAAATVWKPSGPTGFPRRAITLTHPTMLVRAGAFRACGGYRHGFLAAEDYDLLFRLARLGDIVELPQQLLQYRVHSRSESATKISRQRISCLKAEVFDYLSDMGADVSQFETTIDDRTAEALCRTAGQIGHGIPGKEILWIYYSGEYLRRATYRLSSSDAFRAARETFSCVVKLAPQVSDKVARHFMAKATKELLRWSLVAATKRGGKRAGA